MAIIFCKRRNTYKEATALNIKMNVRRHQTKLGKGDRMGGNPFFVALGRKNNPFLDWRIRLVGFSLELRFSHSIPWESFRLFLPPGPKLFFSHKEQHSVVIFHFSFQPMLSRVVNRPQPTAVLHLYSLMIDWILIYDVFLSKSFLSSCP